MATRDQTKNDDGGNGNDDAAKDNLKPVKGTLSAVTTLTGGHLDWRVDDGLCLNGVQQFQGFVCCHNSLSLDKAMLRLSGRNLHQVHNGTWSQTVAESLASRQTVTRGLTIVTSVAYVCRSQDSTSLPTRV